MFKYFIKGNKLRVHLNGNIKKYFSIVLLFLSVININTANAVSIEGLAKHSEFYNVKISPDGKHLAVLVNTEGRKTLAFLDSKTFKVTARIGGERRDQVANYYWVNNERVVIQVEHVRGSQELPVSYGEIFAVNYDGKKGLMIYGYRAKNPTKDGGFLVDILKDNDKFVLIESRRFSRNSDVIPQIKRLNVYTGSNRNVKRAPIPYSTFLIDHSGTPRFVSGTDDDYHTKLFYSPKKGEKWQPFGDEFEGSFQPVGFAPDNNSIYALKSTDGSPEGLYHYELETGKETLLFQSEIADPTYTISSQLNDVFGLKIDEDYPRYVYLDKNSPDAILHDSLVKAFNGDSVVVTSKTEDGKQAIVHVSGDRNPGVFYLFNTETMQARHLLNARKWIKSTEMAMTEPFRIKSEDGLTLNGYLTLPIGKDKNLPTIILPHGGPHARDYWGYDPLTQLLASRGYAVVKVNFRGSTGYGRNFEEAGYENWGTKIQDDINRATQYVVERGVADKDRMCIFGASFGGYSALQSAIRYPDTFKCAIGYAGVYDLEMLYDEGDIRSIAWGDAYLDTTLGSDKAEQRQQSPVHHVDELKVPVLIIHGEDDERAPIEHAEALREALDKADHPYEWLVKDKEGHGFYNEENIIESYEEILSFLEKHLGK